MVLGWLIALVLVFLVVAFIGPPLTRLIGFFHC
jgi:hypothetical protein